MFQLLDVSVPMFVKGGRIVQTPLQNYTLLEVVFKPRRYARGSAMSLVILKEVLYITVLLLYRPLTSSVTTNKHSTSPDNIASISSTSGHRLLQIKQTADDK